MWCWRGEWGWRWGRVGWLGTSYGGGTPRDLHYWRHAPLIGGAAHRYFSSLPPSFIPHPLVCPPAHPSAHPPTCHIRPPAHPARSTHLLPQMPASPPPTASSSAARPATTAPPLCRWVGCAPAPAWRLLPALASGGAVARGLREAAEERVFAQLDYEWLSHAYECRTLLILQIPARRLPLVEHSGHTALLSRPPCWLTTAHHPVGVPCAGVRAPPVAGGGQLPHRAGPAEGLSGGAVTGAELPRCTCCHVCRQRSSCHAVRRNARRLRDCRPAPCVMPPPRRRRLLPGATAAASCAAQRCPGPPPRPPSRISNTVFHVSISMAPAERRRSAPCHPRSAHPLR